MKKRPRRTEFIVRQGDPLKGNSREKKLKACTMLQAKREMLRSSFVGDVALVCTKYRFYEDALENYDTNWSCYRCYHHFFTLPPFEED